MHCYISSVKVSQEDTKDNFWTLHPPVWTAESRHSPVELAANTCTCCRIARTASWVSRKVFAKSSRICKLVSSVRQLQLLAFSLGNSSAFARPRFKRWTGCLFHGTSAPRFDCSNGHSRTQRVQQYAKPALKPRLLPQ